MARQLVSQGHVRVSQRRTDRGSYLVRAGENIELSQTARNIPTVVEELQQGYDTPSWLKREDTNGQVLGMPVAEDVQAQVDAAKIIAFYSRKTIVSMCRSPSPQKGHTTSSKNIFMQAATGIGSSIPNTPATAPPMMTTSMIVTAFKFVWPLWIHGVRIQPSKNCTTP
jgi:hypothetical protein